MRALNCPHCAATDANLVVVERHGIEIDYCPRCRGIWLDRGELDKLIDLEAARTDDFADEIRGVSREANGDDHGGGYRSGHDSTRRRKRGGFLSDMFDFG